MSYRPPQMVFRHGRLVPRQSIAEFSPTPNIPLRGPEAVEAAPVEAPLTSTHKIIIFLFIICLLTPIGISLGPIRLTPYNFFLLMGCLPLVSGWMQRKYSPIILPDVLILCFVMWAAICMFVNHGLAIEPISMHVLTTFVAYLAGRQLIRNEAAWRHMLLAMAVAVTLYLPFILVEVATGQNLILDAASIFDKSIRQVHIGGRMGLFRAQGAFEHPILLGIFSSSLFALFIYTFTGQRARVQRWLGIISSVSSTLLSLSSGPLLGLNLQLGLMLWNRLLRLVKRRWWILFGIVVVLYVAVDLISTKSPFHVFVNNLTFSRTSSYNRILIWQFGTQNVWNNPVFGLGLNDWVRPRWMHGSMDNFWLIQAVRYGMPGVLLVMGAVVMVMRRLATAKLTDERLSVIRTGMMFSITATCVAISSVHLWNQTYVWFTFLLGSSAWLGQQRTCIDHDEPKRRPLDRKFPAQTLVTPKRHHH
jgi:hypothetical protein